MVTTGLGAILALHIVVLATAGPLNKSVAIGEPINYSTASIVLQAISMFLPAAFAALAAARSRDFARSFWTLTSFGFATQLAALISWHLSPPENFSWNDFIFLLHMVPFGLALLLTDRRRIGRVFNWPMLLDYLQILMLVVVLYTGFIRRKTPGSNLLRTPHWRGAAPDGIARLKAREEV
jgi:hypothetical protein